MRATPILTALLMLLLFGQCTRQPKPILGHFDLLVVDAQGVPQGGVEVMVYDDYRWPELSVADRVVHSAPDPLEIAKTSIHRFSTNYAGKATLPLLSDATVVVCKTDTHYGVQYAQTLEPHTLVLEVEKSLVMQVVDANGKPAAGIGVGMFHAVHPDDLPHPDVAVFTDAEGLAVLPHLQRYAPFQSVRPHIRVLGLFEKPLLAVAMVDESLQQEPIRFQLPKLTPVEVTLGTGPAPVGGPYAWLSLRDPAFPEAPSLSFMAIDGVVQLPPIERGREVELRLFPGEEHADPSATLGFRAVAGDDGWMRLALNVGS